MKPCSTSLYYWHGYCQGSALTLKCPCICLNLGNTDALYCPAYVGRLLLSCCTVGLSGSTPDSGSGEEYDHCCVYPLFFRKCIRKIIAVMGIQYTCVNDVVAVLFAAVLVICYMPV